MYIGWEFLLISVLVVDTLQRVVNMELMLFQLMERSRVPGLPLKEFYGATPLAKADMIRFPDVNTTIIITTLK